MSMMMCEVCDAIVDTDYADFENGKCENCITDDQEEHGGDYPDRL